MKKQQTKNKCRVTFGANCGKLKVIKMPNSFDILGYPHNVTALLASHRFCDEVCKFVVEAINETEEDEFIIELKNDMFLLVNRPVNLIEMVKDNNNVIETLHFSVLD